MSDFIRQELLLESRRTDHGYLCPAPFDIDILDSPILNDKRYMFVSKRTLARRLEREGTGYRQIRDDLLSELAAKHLRESDLTVEAVAALLGYHDTANFHRAFRRWFKVSPSAFRRGAVA